MNVITMMNKIIIVYYGKLTADEYVLDREMASQPQKPATDHYYIQMIGDCIKITDNNR